MMLLKILIFIPLFLTILSMVAGLGVMGQGGPLNRKFSNILMEWRVWLQGITVVLLLLALRDFPATMRQFRKGTTPAQNYFKSSMRIWQNTTGSRHALRANISKGPNTRKNASDRAENDSESWLGTVCTCSYPSLDTV